jgi:hypothetical protein
MTPYEVRNQIAVERALIDESKLTRLALARERRDRMIAAAFGSVPAPDGYRLKTASVSIEIDNETIDLTADMENPNE